jgi:hypothetical protein
MPSHPPDPPDRFGLARETKVVADQGSAIEIKQVNTYSEIDVISGSATEAMQTASAATPPFLIKSADGKCDITIDTSGATDLKEWAETKLAPVLAEWFPKIVAMLPSDGYTPPSSLSVTIRPGRGVAATSGTRVTANANWLRRNARAKRLARSCTRRSMSYNFMADAAATGARAADVFLVGWSKASPIIFAGFFTNRRATVRMKFG